MLKGRIGNGAVTTHGFLLGMEVDGPLDVDAVMEKLVENVLNIKHIGQIDVEYLGELDLIKEDGVEGEIEGIPQVKSGVRES